MMEIESKILEINKEEIIEKLDKMNYIDKKERKLISLLYDTKEDSIVKKGGIVRLRFDGQKGYLTIKTPIENNSKGIKMFNEDEKEINFEEKEKELKNTHILLLKTEKHRISYTFENCIVEIDEYLGNMNYIPTFLEIEAENEEIIITKARELGFDKGKLYKGSTLDLIKKYST